MFSDYRVWLRIGLRCLIEFGPPAAIATYSTWPDPVSSGVKFSAAFVGVGLFWWNFLRIQYQQTNRFAQDKASGQISQVHESLDHVKRMLAAILPIIDHGNLTPEQAAEVSKVVSQANNAITTANTALETMQKTSMSFRFGPLEASYSKRSGPVDSVKIKSIGPP